MKIDVVYNPAHTSRQKPEKHVVALSYSKSFSQKTKYSPYKQATWTMYPAMKVVGSLEATCKQYHSE